MSTAGIRRLLARLRLFLVFVLAASAATGCFLRPKKSDAGKGGRGGGTLIRKSDIFVDRIGDGDTAKIAFVTEAPAHCEIAFYSQDADGKPTKDSPGVSACQDSAEGQTSFTEKVAGLQTDTLYFFVIRAWRHGTGKETAESLTVRETPNPGTIIAPGGGADGTFSELLVARFDIPLKMAEIHRHALAKPTTVADIKAALNPTSGCQQGEFSPPAPFRDATKELGLENLATRDFASGTSRQHPESPGRLQLLYPGINDGMDKWTLLYQIAGKDAQVPVLPMTRLANVDIEAAGVATLDSAQLDSPVDPLPVSGDQPLVVRWTTTGNVRSDATITVQIGRSGYSKAVACVFSASVGNGSIEAKYLAGLDAGKHVISVELGSRQLLAKDGWLALVSDWRSGRLEKAP